MTTNKKGLTITNLSVSFSEKQRVFPALEDISFAVSPNQVVGIVGESGSGKSLTAQAILGILPTTAQVESGSIRLDSQELLDLSEKEWQQFRGKKISMIFQEPMTALNPLMTVGRQIDEALLQNGVTSKTTRKEKVLHMMEEVGLTEVEQLYQAYPHQLSGGMRQRIVIAIAIINEPDLIIADEPTTALDVTIQAQILQVLKKILDKRNSSMIFISHNWGVIRQICDTVVVMYAGRIVEQGKTEAIIQKPYHPYTQSLLKAIPDRHKKGQKLYTIPFRVPTLSEREKGKWPYITKTAENEESLAAMFPETNQLYNKKSGV